MQTAFRETGARLQSVYDHKQRCELEMAKREQDIKQLQGWKHTVSWGIHGSHVKHLFRPVK